MAEGALAASGLRRPCILAGTWGAGRRSDGSTYPTMKTKLLISAGALTLCLSAPTAWAQGSSFTTGRGLNGTDYLSPTFLYSNGDNLDYTGVGFRLNKTMHPSFDLIATTGFTRSERVAGARADSRDFDAGVRWHTNAGWGRPFVEATLGYNWWKYVGARDNSLTYAFATGVELQLTEKFSLAPLVGYSEATDYDDSGDFYGVLRTNCWLNDRWSVRVNFSFSEDGNGLGAGFAWAF